MPRRDEAVASPLRNAGTEFPCCIGRETRSARFHPRALSAAVSSSWCRVRTHDGLGTLHTLRRQCQGHIWWFVECSRDQIDGQLSETSSSDPRDSGGIEAICGSGLRLPRIGQIDRNVRARTSPVGAADASRANLPRHCTRLTPSGPYCRPDVAAGGCATRGFTTLRSRNEGLPYPGTTGLPPVHPRQGGLPRRLATANTYRVIRPSDWRVRWR